MPADLESAWEKTLDRLMGPAGIGEDAGIMAAQLERASTILDRPTIDHGSLFETEPAQFYATLDRYSVSRGISA